MNMQFTVIAKKETPIRPKKTIKVISQEEAYLNTISLKVNMLDKLSDVQRRVVKENFEMDKFDINENYETVVASSYVEREDNNNVQCVQQ